MPVCVYIHNVYIYMYVYVMYIYMCVCGYIYIYIYIYVYGGAGGNRGWDGWVVSLIQWKWVWTSPGRQWRTVWTPWHAAVHEVAKNQTQLSYWTMKTVGISVQFSSVTRLCPTLCNPMDCSTTGFPVHHKLPGACSKSCPLSRWCHPTISSSVVPFSSHLQSFPASRSFPVSQFFISVA